MKSKKAAMEMSVGTIVTIVLLMSVLILGIFLVQKIFGGATDSVDVVNKKIMSEINNLFQDESSEVIVKLGSDKKAKIRVGTEDFGIAIGAKTYNGGPATRERLQYKLTLDDISRENCLTKLGRHRTENLIDQPMETWINFDEFDGANTYAIISCSIPKATEKCSQKILMDVRDNEQDADVMAGTFFRIELLSKLL